ncbi:SIS domain-containing protein [Streptomyces sp. NP160]|uniref:SIS domain-containing protein n=1 Tax=Streptomyces sp. NP160 TaxID=2586637 RepID=UPI00111B895C|nr:SIS domain-containing protein [Streptomyces sp. NP160]TNM63157.1 SIS domain-containing protein [Streptomyces sp. NP160]
MITTTPFEQDVLAQPEALRALASQPVPTELSTLARKPWQRIVLTGMGSSHFASVPTWRSLAARGRAVWAVDTGQLLDTPELITSDTLVIATSQSGASGEVVELISRMQDGHARAGGLIGITADPDSPLAQAAHGVGLLHCGPEATVSTKSYLNTLVVHAQLTAALVGEDIAAVGEDAVRIADTVEDLIQVGVSTALAKGALSHDRPRLAAVGWEDAAATSQFAGLITKESTKLAIEGFVGGQFRHGPLELAGPGLTVYLYGAHSIESDGPLATLARDVLATGASVNLIGDLQVAGAETIAAPSRTSLEGLATGAVIAQLLAVDLARENGVVPGAFAFGSKITTSL